MNRSTIQSYLLALTVTIIIIINVHFLNNNNGIFVNGERYFACTPAYCSAYGKCGDFTCRGRNKVVFKNVTQCGCCNRCVEEHPENDECPNSIYGNIPSDQCGPHLTCVSSGDNFDSKCRKINSKCELERTSIEENPSQAFIRAPKPECDEYGQYKPKQCKSGALCHCVDENGDFIFGTAAAHESRSMNCLCSRQFLKLNRKLIEYGSKPLAPINFMRCKKNGNYQEFQSHNGYDYCVFSQNGTLQDRPVLKRFSKDLPCSKTSYPFMTPCIAKYNEAIANITKLEKQGFSVVGFETPKCDLDGSYQPVQCFNNKCTCVDKNGIPLKDSNGIMEVDRNDPDLANNQQCTCARNFEEIRSIPESKRNKITDLFRRYQCNKNGNYLPIQCSDAACYCVDPITGYVSSNDNQKGNSHVLKSDPDAIKTLFCYINYHNKEQLDKIFHIA